ncbi:hypothetical protein DBB36_12985 [Flavobacterium sp. WLB]|uniref:DUF2625 domain-containing protein n=2 Tax=Flavobacterium panici TaxID=2654843 RepID=A0A9N8J2E3_9FLAO|nr:MULTISPECIES: DUF2625 domain-containing protein [Flavobacterium]PUU69608.1 hypothetical protein DBB36_12985 [Flavobacterium sp. WLB]UUF14142.1 DUF2625 domain-containing protein [Flavobacterium panici]CAC9975021.1 hypothetical protein FLAPXU55_02724 [Flavobacterium panici]
MIPKFPLLVLTFLTFAATAQNKMKKAEELIDKADPGWTLVEDWIKTATNKVEVLPVDAVKAKDALYKTQVTTRSTMGAVIFNTGGILIDDGWIRILGSGSSKFNRSLPDWNKGKTFNEFGETPAFLLIADDAIGGFYFLNGGGLGTDVGKIYYFSPDNLEFEQLDITYSEFLGFCFSNNLDKFYEGNRWNGWRTEVSKLKGDEVFNFYPFLWTAEGSDINKNSRKIIPVQEQYSLNLDLRKQLGFDK